MSALSVNHLNSSPNACRVLLEEHKGKIVTLVALMALACLIAGGVLFYLGVNTAAASSLVGIGGTLAIVDALLFLVLICCKKNRKNSEQQSSHMGSQPIDEEPLPPKILTHHSYKIVSWNVGSFRDYSKMCSIRHRIRSGKTFAQAYQEFCAENSWKHATQGEKMKRIEIFQRAFKQFDQPDIICLQETNEMDEHYLAQILPAGYTSFSYKDKDGKHNCTIAWDSAKFVASGYIKVDDPSDGAMKMPTHDKPDTLVLLEDFKDHTKICVASTHMCGYSLAEEHKNKADTQLRIQKGYNQTESNLIRMERVGSDCTLLAGDFNVTTRLNPQRFELLKNYQYSTDETDKEPTIYDANLKESNGSPMAVKLDHIFANVRGENRSIKKIALKRVPLNQFDFRASDHLPIAAEVSWDS